MNKSIGFNDPKGAYRLYREGIGQGAGKLVYHSAHSTYMIAVREAKSVLRMGMSRVVELFHHGRIETFTVAPMTRTGTASGRQVYRDGNPI